MDEILELDAMTTINGVRKLNVPLLNLKFKIHLSREMRAEGGIVQTQNINQKNLNLNMSGPSLENATEEQQREILKKRIKELDARDRIKKNSIYDEFVKKPPHPDDAKEVIVEVESGKSEVSE
jgi:hypothetical protein